MKKEIYYIKSTTTGRLYVGSTTRGIRQRFSEHLYYLRHGSHHSKHLQRVYDKYGEGDLSMESVYVCTEDENILEVEQRHLDKHKDICMNTAPVSNSIYAAHAANRARTMPKEERERRSASAKKAIAEGRAIRNKWSDEKKEKHSKILTGRKMPPVKQSTKENISKALKLRHALLGTSAKPKTADRRTAFIEQEVDSWILLRKQGKSYREIERIAKRSRGVIARECEKRIADATT